MSLLFNKTVLSYLIRIMNTVFIHSPAPCWTLMLKCCATIHSDNLVNMVTTNSNKQQSNENRDHTTTALLKKNKVINIIKSSSHSFQSFFIKCFIQHPSSQGNLSTEKHVIIFLIIFLHPVLCHDRSVWSSYVHHHPHVIICVHHHHHHHPQSCCLP